MSRDRVSEIEDAIASGKMSAAQVFTQMRQLIPRTEPRAGDGDAEMARMLDWLEVGHADTLRDGHSWSMYGKVAALIRRLAAQRNEGALGFEVRVNPNIPAGTVIATDADENPVAMIKNIDAAQRNEGDV